MAGVVGMRDLWRRDRVWPLLQPPLQLDTRHGTVLYLEDISVNFDGFQALDALNLYIDSGELRCLIGPNGAGKTTLMDVITGRTRPDTGSAWFGQRIDLLTLDETAIARAGIGRKFQKPTVFEQHSVRANLDLAAAGGEPLWQVLTRPSGAEIRDRVEATAETIGLENALAQPAAVLSHGQKQWLEIGMLLMQKPRLLLIDEPVAGMTAEESERTAELLLSLAGDHSLLVVEHDMGFVRSIATRVTVLHAGGVLAEGSLDAVAGNADVRRVYLGE